jgi:hypothetical protein
MWSLQELKTGESSISRQCNLPIYRRGWSMLKAILMHCLKNWMQKHKDKWFFDCLLWKRWAHSLIKRFTSCSHAPCISMTIEIKWCLLWNLLYLAILSMVLSFTTTAVDQLMTS